MKNLERYKKTARKGRKTYVSSVNLEFYQHKILKEKSLNLSLLIRDLLEDYFTKFFPERYEELKNIEDNIETSEDLCEK